MYICLKCTQFLKINAGNSLSVRFTKFYPQATGGLRDAILVATVPFQTNKYFGSPTSTYYNSFIRTLSPYNKLYMIT